MKFAKTLSVLLLSMNLLAGYNPEVFKKEFNFLPKKFKNYRENAKEIKKRYGYINKRLFWIVQYKTYLGGNVAEMYPVIEKNGITTHEDEPFVFGFDLDGNGCYNPNEMWQDFMTDGLNGLEVRGYYFGF